MLYYNHLSYIQYIYIYAPDGSAGAPSFISWWFAWFRPFFNYGFIIQREIFHVNCRRPLWGWLFGWLLRGFDLQRWSWNMAIFHLRKAKKWSPFTRPANWWFWGFACTCSNFHVLVDAWMHLFHSSCTILVQKWLAWLLPELLHISQSGWNFVHFPHFTLDKKKRGKVQPIEQVQNKNTPED